MNVSFEGVHHRHLKLAQQPAEVDTSQLGFAGNVVDVPVRSYDLDLHCYAAHDARNAMAAC